MRYKKIRDLVEEVLQPSINFIKKSRKRSTMPFKEMRSVLGVFFPKTKHTRHGKGFFKQVFTIHFGKKKLALKVGRARKDIRKDYTTYVQLCRRVGANKANRNFAKIYWKTVRMLPFQSGKWKIMAIRKAIRTQGHSGGEHNEIRSHLQNHRC